MGRYLHSSAASMQWAEHTGKHGISMILDNVGARYMQMLAMIIAGSCWVSFTKCMLPPLKRSTICQIHTTTRKVRIQHLTSTPQVSPIEWNDCYSLAHGAGLFHFQPSCYHFGRSKSNSWDPGENKMSRGHLKWWQRNDISNSRTWDKREIQKALANDYPTVHCSLDCGDFLPESTIIESGPACHRLWWSAPANCTGKDSLKCQCWSSLSIPWRRTSGPCKHRWFRNHNRSRLCCRSRSRSHKHLCHSHSRKQHCRSHKHLCHSHSRKQHCHSHMQRCHSHTHKQRCRRQMLCCRTHSPEKLSKHQLCHSGPFCCQLCHSHMQRCHSHHLRHSHLCCRSHSHMHHLRHSHLCCRSHSHMQRCHSHSHMHHSRRSHWCFHSHMT